MSQLVMVPNPAGPSAMGMDLSTNFTLAGNGSAQQVTGFAARSGFGGTVITSNKLVADGTGTWTVNSKTTVSTTWNDINGMVMTIMKNSATFGTYTVAYQSSTATFTPASISLVSGDTVWLQYTCQTFDTASLVSGATNTYLYFS